MSKTLKLACAMVMRDGNVVLQMVHQSKLTAITQPFPAVFKIQKHRFYSKFMLLKKFI